ncbi:fungal-specific transcription factor domain-containing protein [Mycena maculata]|uniref:Fungal-specific transcription factor domain-containing protein n=1 Tax=Mycena maculata TaxID=230809 RepID=A0AAD7MUK0_9AGAR|nr:fungal-specific transcription factor domain-containing protein [Mycena maculata]
MALNPAFKSLSDQEKIEIKRMAGKAPCAECKRLKLKCDRSIPCASCVRRSCGETCPTGTYRPTGRGRRSVPTEASRLKRTVAEMEDRIKELEITITTNCDYHLPFCPYLGVSVKKLDSSLDNLADSLGAMSVNDTGEAQYFGRTAGTEALLSMGNESITEGVASTFVAITDSFSFGPGEVMSWNPEHALIQFSVRLPTNSRAWELCEVYFQNGCWSGTPLMREEFTELLSEVYGSPEGSGPRSLSPSCSVHQMAVLYGVFALGALVDLTLLPYNHQSEYYFDLARAALSVVSVFDNPSLATVQALVLVSVFLSHGGSRFSMEGAWSTISMASHICQTMGLHNGRPQPGLTPRQLQRQRALFWETYSIETLQSLAVGRPAGTYLASISCPFPTDDEQQLDDTGGITHGYYRRRWEFVKQVAAPVAESCLTARVPGYDVIVDLDQRIRKFMQSPMCTKLSAAADQSSPSAYFQSRMVHQACTTMLLYIHNNNFMQAMRENPDDPYYTPHASSFLSAYRYASEIIKAGIENFTHHPELFLRWWSIWKSLFNAAIIVGGIAAQCPQNVYGPRALLELFVAVDLFERGAATSFRARGALNVLRRLRDKAITAYAKRAGGAGPHDEADAALAVFAGATRIVAQSILARQHCVRALELYPTPPHTPPLAFKHEQETASVFNLGPCWPAAGLDPALEEYLSASSGEIAMAPRRDDGGLAAPPGDLAQYAEASESGQTAFEIPPFFLEGDQEPQWNAFLQNL